MSHCNNMYIGGGIRGREENYPISRPTSCHPFSFKENINRQLNILFSLLRIRFVDRQIYSYFIIFNLNPRKGYSCWW